MVLGTIVKLSGNRRKPWCAKVTEGITQKIICNEKGEKYFAERWQAEEALLWWNKNHNIINTDKLSYTFKQLFDEWENLFIPTPEERRQFRKDHKEIKGKLGVSNAMGLLAASKRFKPLWNKRYNTLKKIDFQKIINNTTGKRTKLVDMRNLIMKLDEYALR